MDGRTDGRTRSPDMKELVVAFRNSAKAPERGHVMFCHHDNAIQRRQVGRSVRAGATLFPETRENYVLAVLTGIKVVLYGHVCYSLVFLTFSLLIFPSFAFFFLLLLFLLFPPFPLVPE